MEDPARGHQLSETLTASPSAAGAAGSSPRIVDGYRLQPGTRVDRYEVIELLGEGSMGRVYRARDTDLGRDVALKRINLGQWNILTAQMRLRREARAMARVEHPAVIRIYDVPIVEGELFVAMELARGGTLASWVKARPRRWRDIVRAFLEAGRGLAAAHHAGLVHRDIKPSNILVDAHGHAKIGDFGLARMFDGEPRDGDDGVDATAGTADPPPAAGLDVSLTRTGAIAGTLGYMAPEQLTGGTVDARADQFAFCVALWEALCGRRPFAATQDDLRSPDALLGAIAAGPLEGPRSGARVPRRILAPLRRGLAADRERRWRSMDELLDALERATRVRVLRWIALVLVLDVAIGLAIAAARCGSDSSPPSPSSAQAAVACGKREQIARVWNPGVRASYVSGPDAAVARQEAAWLEEYACALDAEYAAACKRAEPQRIACLDDAVEDLRAAIARTPRTYWPRLRAVDLCATRLGERDLGDIGYDEDVRLSTDGRQLVVGAKGRRSIIRQLDGSGRRPIDLTTPLRWLPDGTLVGQDGAGRVVVVDPATGATGATGATTRSFDGACRLVDVSADLRSAAFAAGGQLSIVPLAGGAPLTDPLATDPRFWAGGNFSPDGRWFAAIVNAGRISVDDRPAMLHVDSLESRQRNAITYRLHVNGTGGSSVRWLDGSSFLVTGSATPEVAGDLWRVRIDAAGQIVGPPQIIQRSERDTVLIPLDVQGGRILVSKLRIAEQNLVIDGESSFVRPRSVSLPRLVGADRAREHLLAASNPAQTRWVWMSLDGMRVAPIPALDGLSSAVIAPSGLAALDLRYDPPTYVAFDEAGAELLRLPLDAARGATPAARGGPVLRCGTSRCVVKWTAGGRAVTLTITGRTVGAPVHHDAPEIASGFMPWDLSPDGNTLAIPTDPWSSSFVLYDLSRAAAHRVTSDACRTVQIVRFLANGVLALSGISHSPGLEFVLVRRDAAGRERTLWHGDAWVPSIVPLDDRRVIASTVSYQTRLALFELP